eukprot:359155-Chlamydomonas_euryale.AAC.6
MRADWRRARRRRQRRRRPGPRVPAAGGPIPAQSSALVVHLPRREPRRAQRRPDAAAARRARRCEHGRRRAARTGQGGWEMREAPSSARPARSPTAHVAACSTNLTSCLGIVGGTPLVGGKQAVALATDVHVARMHAQRCCMRLACRKMLPACSTSAAGRLSGPATCIAPKAKHIQMHDHLSFGGHTMPRSAEWEQCCGLVDMPRPQSVRRGRSLRAV